MNDTVLTLHQSAVKALNKGDYRTLHQLCLTILSKDDKHADAWFFLSIVAASQMQARKAIEFVDRALIVAPNQTEYLSQKAKYHSLLKQDYDAYCAAQKAEQLNPENALTLDTLGVVYTNLGRFESARKLLQKAVEKQPKNPQFHFNLATSEQFLGDNASAKYHYEQAIRINPKFARAYWSLSELEKNSVDTSRTSTLEKLIEEDNLSPQDELYFAHSLSRAYEQDSEYAKAFSVLEKAKARMSSRMKYLFDDDKAMFESMQIVFAKGSENIQERGDVALEETLGQEVIFIVGMPRSGTTLIERILSSHSDVESLGELQNFGIAVRKFVDSASNKMLDEEVMRKAMLVDPQKIGEEYLRSLKNRRTGKKFFIDKMPLNFLYIGFIRRCLPGAKIVCVRRNPMDTCLSNFRQLFAMTFSYYNYHYDIQNTAKYFACFHELMRFWKHHFGSALHEVNYENLTQNPQENIEALLNYVGLDWQQACLDFHNNKSAVSTPSAVQVREKMYTTAVGRWRKYEAQLQSVMQFFDEQGIQYR